jgi:hypothetical protein
VNGHGFVPNTSVSPGATISISSKGTTSTAGGVALADGVVPGSLRGGSHRHRGPSRCRPAAADSGFQVDRLASAVPTQKPADQCPEQQASLGRKGHVGRHADDDPKDDANHGANNNHKPHPPAISATSDRHRERSSTHPLSRDDFLRADRSSAL